jgi:hypothetical protein
LATTRPVEDDRLVQRAVQIQPQLVANLDVGDLRPRVDAQLGLDVEALVRRRRGADARVEPVAVGVQPQRERALLVGRALMHDHPPIAGRVALRPDEEADTEVAVVAADLEARGIGHLDVPDAAVDAHRGAAAHARLEPPPAHERGGVGGARAILHLPARDGARSNVQ